MISCLCCSSFRSTFKKCSFADKALPMFMNQFFHPLFTLDHYLFELPVNFHDSKKAKLNHCV